MTSIGSLVVEMSANIAGLDANLQKAVAKLNSTTAQMNRRLGTLQKGFDGVAAAAKTALAAYVGGRALSSFIETAKDVQTLEARLNFLTGSAQKAGETNRFLAQTAQTLGLNVLALSKNYAAFLPLVNAGLLSTEQARKTTLGLADASAALGANSRQLGQVMYGLSQALSTPIVKTQDFRQVVAPLPGLLQAMDRAAGLSAGGFLEMVQASKVTSAYFRDTLIKALGDFSGAAAANANNLQGLFNKLDAAYVELVKELAGPVTEFGITPPIKELTEQIHELNAAIAAVKTGDLKSRLETVANYLLRHSPPGLVADKLIEIYNGAQGLKSDVAVPFRSHRRLSRPAQIPLTGTPGFRSEQIPSPRARPADLAENVDKYRVQVKAALDDLETEWLRAQGHMTEVTRRETDKQIAEYQDLRDKGLISEAQYEDARQQLNDIANQKIRDSNDALFQAQRDEMDRTARAAEEMGNSLRDAFEQAIFRGNSFMDVLNAVIRRIEFAALFGTDSKSGLFGGIIDKLANGAAQLFTGGSSVLAPIDTSKFPSKLPGYANGGYPPIDRPFLVGEHGPEIMKLGRSSTVFPIPPGGGALVQQNIAPVFAGNAATKEDLITMAALTKKATEEAIMSHITRPRH